MKGNMRSQTYVYGSRPDGFSRLGIESHRVSSLNACATGGLARALRRVLAVVMAILLLRLGQGEAFAQQGPAEQESPQGSPQDYPQNYPQNDPNNGQYPPEQPPDNGQAQQPVQPLAAEQLEQLVAPIALYPDALVAQVLAAATYPAQVEDADRWRRAQGYASPDQIAYGADAQNWDPSVKALTAFPQVLAEMARNLQWTTDLGNAYYNQPQDVLASVQVMRHRAFAAGNLRSTPQEAVTYDQDNIELAPVNPQLVYVPAYNPWVVYGQPVAPYPGFSLLGAIGSFIGSSFGSSFGTSPISFGLGIAMTAFSHTPWGWLAWGLSWLSQSVLFNHGNYYSHSATVADWGFRHGGPRAFANRGGIGGFANNFNRGREFVPRPPNGYGRPSREYNEARGRNFVPRPPSGYDRRGGSYNVARGRDFVPRPPSNYNRPSGYGAGRAEFAPRQANSYGRPGGEYNVARGRESVPRPQVGRPQQYARSDFGSSYGRPAASYGRGRAPASFQRNDFGKKSSHGFMRSSAKQERSGGFHPFGGGHAPKGFSGGKSYGRGHSGGGSHSGGHGGGKHHH